MVVNISQDTEISHPGVVHVVEDGNVLLHFFASAEDVKFTHEGEEHTLALNTLSPGSMSIRSTAMRKDIYETYNISEENQGKFQFFNMEVVDTSDEVDGIELSIKLTPVSNDETNKFASEEGARIAAAEAKRAARLEKDNQ